MRIPGKWEEWAKYNSDGFLCGISEDAPEEAKKEYEEYVKETEAAKKRGIKI